MTPTDSVYYCIGLDIKLKHEAQITHSGYLRSCPVAINGVIESYKSSPSVNTLVFDLVCAHWMRTLR